MKKFFGQSPAFKRYHSEFDLNQLDMREGRRFYKTESLADLHPEKMMRPQAATVSRKVTFLMV